MRARASSYDDREVETLLAGRGGPDEAGLLNVLQGLQRLAAGPAPEPSAALAAVLSGAAPLPPAPADLARRPGAAHRRRQQLRAAALLMVAGVGVTTAGAAANALPAPAQRAAAQVLNTLTPFHFPTPHAAATPAVTVPTATPSPANPPLPQPAATTSSEDQRPEPGDRFVEPRGSQDSRTGDSPGDAGQQDTPAGGSRTTGDGSDQEPAPVNGQSQPRPVTPGAAQPSSDPTPEPAAEPTVQPSDGSETAGPGPVS